MQFKRWLVEIGDDVVAVVAAPGPGAAIEFTLATHGMFGYGTLPRVREVRLDLTVATEADFRKIMKGMGEENNWAELEEWHQWQGKGQQQKGTSSDGTTQEKGDSARGSE